MLLVYTEAPCLKQREVKEVADTFLANTIKHAPGME